jgi:hypothetical protein
VTIVDATSAGGEKAAASRVMRAVKIAHRVAIVPHAVRIAARAKSAHRVKSVHRARNAATRSVRAADALSTRRPREPKATGRRLAARASAAMRDATGVAVVAVAGVDAGVGRIARIVRLRWPRDTRR